MSIVLYTEENNIGTITLNRPEVKNAVNMPLYEALHAALLQARDDANAKVIVLTGSGDAFCSGADISAFKGDGQTPIDYGDYLRNTYNRLIELITGMEKPIIAYINGIAVGAGLSLALACDYRIAHPQARMGITFLNIGLVPDAGASYFMPRLVGMSKALELALGDIIDAEEAKRIGLVNDVGEPDALIERLLQLPTRAYTLMKQTFTKSYESSLADVLAMEEVAQREAGQTKEHLLAVQAFLGKSKG